MTLLYKSIHIVFMDVFAGTVGAKCVTQFMDYSLRFGKRRRFGQDLSQTLGI
jgi:hypothetical protein